MKIYYAHSILKYNTPIETYELGVINRVAPNSEIINPNGGLGYSEYSGLTEDEIMGICIPAVKKSNFLVFSSINGVIGHGVFDEILAALETKIPIYHIQNNDLKLCKKSHINFEIINESRRIYAIVKINER